MCSGQPTLFINNKKINMIKSVSTAITGAHETTPRRWVSQLVQKKNLVLSNNAAKYNEASILPKNHME